MTDKDNNDIPALKEFLRRKAKVADKSSLDGAIGALSMFQDSEYGSDTVIEPDENTGDTKTGDVSPVLEFQPDSGAGRYEISGEVARGGMGIILNAFDSNIRRDVAMKVITGDWQESREFIERFVREAQVQGQLEHPNICPVHELGVDKDGLIYFTMKMVHGESLAERIKRVKEEDSAGDPKRLTGVLNVFLKICDGIAFAHSRGIIHRDLKPDNIMVGDFGEVYVMDWGLGKIVGSVDDRRSGLMIADPGMVQDTMKTMTGSVVGTPAYMPPEQALGQVEEMDERSDLYSLGALLYELLSLEPPFSGETSWDILSQIGKRPPLPPSRRDPGKNISTELDSIVMKSLAKNKEDRYQSALGMKHDIELFLSGRPIGAMEYSIWHLFAKWISRNRVLAFSFLVVMLILVVSFAVSFIRIAASEREAVLQRDLAEEQRVIAETERTQAEEQRKIAEERRIEAEKTELESRFSLAMIYEERGDIGESIRIYQDIKYDLRQKRLNLFPYIDLMKWKAAYNQGRPVQAVATLRKGESSARSLAFSADGKVLAIGYDNSYIHLWDPVQKRWIGMINVGTTPVHSLAFSPDHTILASGDAGGNVRLWNLAQRRELAALKDATLKSGTAHIKEAASLAFSPDGKLLASSGDEVIKLWNMEKQDLATSLWGHLRNVNSLTFSPDGRYLVSGGEDRMVKLWDVSLGKEIKLLYEHWDHVKSLKFSPNGRFLASTGNDTTIRIWNLEEDREVVTLRGHQAEVFSLAFSPDGKTLVSGGEDSTVRFWDVDRQVVIASFKNHQGRISSVDFSPDGKTAASANSDGTVRIWSLARENLVKTVSLDNYKVYSLAYCPDGRSLAIGTFFPGIAPVFSYDIETAEIAAKLTSHGGRVKSIDFSPDGKLLASCGDDGLLRIMNLENDELAATINVRDEQSTSLFGSLLGTAMEILVKQTNDLDLSISDVAFGPDGRLLATAGSSGKIKLWDTKTFTRMYTFVRSESVITVTFSPDGVLLATAGRNQKPTIWNVKTRELVTVLGENKNTIHSLDFSPDGRLLASGQENGGIVIWNAATWEQVRSLAGHHGRIGNIQFSPDGSLLASCSVDTSVKLWNVATGELLLALQEHEHDVEDLAFSPDGTTLATCSRDHTVKLWKFGDALKPLEF